MRCRQSAAALAVALMEATLRGIRIAILAVAAIASSCASVQPKSQVPYLAVTTNDPSMSGLLSGGYDQHKRNDWIEYNLIRIDSVYYDYERSLQNVRTQWSVGSAASALLLNVASSLTNSAGVKANYVAANSVATGLNQVSNQAQFFEQSVSSLVSAMRAQRAKAFVAIRTGMTKPEGEYTLSDAHRDLLEYERAGTLTQGMTFLTEATKDASAETVDAAKTEIMEAIEFSEDQRQHAFCVTQSLFGLGPAADADLRSVLTTLKVDLPKEPGIGPARQALAKSRDTAANVQFHVDLFEAMKAKKLLIDPCPRY